MYSWLDNVNAPWICKQTKIMNFYNNKVSLLMYIYIDIERERLKQQRSNEMITLLYISGVDVLSMSIYSTQKQ